MKHISLAFAFFSTISIFAQSTIMIGSTEVQVDTVYTGLDIPWEIVYGPDGYIWTTERRGIVSRIDPVNETKDVILDLSGAVYQEFESGLLGMKLHPNFATTPEVFLAYTYEDGPNVKERIVKYTYNGTNLVNEVILLDDIVGFDTHNGARFFIMADNTLLVSTGDAQNQASPQNTNSLNGKTLRMNLDGSIPLDNPISSNYVYSFGHRNVQGIANGPNNTIFISEHGASTDDEFQILEAGRNYGWPNVEGFCDESGEQSFCTTNNVKEPLVAWTPTIAPSDMVYYENPLFPEFDGKMLMTVLKDKKLIALEFDGSGTTVVDQVHYLTNQFGRLRDICVGPNNEIFLATNGANWVNNNPNTHSIIRLKTVATTNLNENSIQKPAVFPNPVVDELKLVVTPNFVGTDIRVSSLSGEMVLKTQLESTTSSLDFTQFQTGVYFILFTSNTGEQFTERVVK